MHGLEAKYGSEMNFVYLDVDDRDTNRYKEALGYIYQPHMFLLDAEGNVIEQWVGYVPDQVLEDALQRALGEG